MQGLLLPPLEVEDRLMMHKNPQEARRYFDELVVAYPDLRIELQKDGTIIVMAPAGGESDRLIDGDTRTVWEYYWFC